MGDLLTVGEKQWVQDLVKQSLVSLKEVQLCIEWHQDTGLALKKILENLVRKKQSKKSELNHRSSRRRFKRDTFFELVELQTDTGTHLVRLNSISRGGAGVLFDRYLPEGLDIVLKQAHTSVVANVVHSIKTDNGWLVGLEYYPKDLEDVLKQEEFINHCKSPHRVSL